MGGARAAGGPGGGAAGRHAPRQLAALSEALRIVRDTANPEATFRMD
ncbi:hypothetical protein [Nocardia abscessus]|nr:hypothetical protein [Nocardia abscessus]